MKVKNDHRSKFSNLSNWKEEVLPGRCTKLVYLLCTEFMPGETFYLSSINLKTKTISSEIAYSNQSTRTPWITKEILNKITKKKRLWRKLKANPSEILSRKFKELRRSVKQLVRSENKRYLEHLSSQLKVNPKRFWSYHSIKSKSKRLPDVNTYNRRSAIKPHEQATLFNIHFHSVFCKQSTGVLAPIQTDLQDPSFEDVINHMTCDTKEVQKLLSCLNANKSCGVDKIPARLLKETADISAVPLSMLFNLSFKQGRLPKLWKSANITPIHKDGDREPVENYRGISLLTISGKCQERIVYNAIYDQVIRSIHW